MLCLKCGRSVGERAGLCDQCQAVEDARIAEAAPPKEVVQRQTRITKIHNSADVLAHSFFTLSNPFVVAALSISALVLFSVLLKLFTPLLALESLLVATVGVISCISLYCWVLLWIELLQENAVIALCSFFVPIATWTIVRTYPERTVRPFIVHFITLVAAVGLSMYLGRTLQPASHYWITTQLFSDPYEHHPLPMSGPYGTGHRSPFDTMPTQSDWRR